MGLATILLLWFLLAYPGLPQLWRHHKHRKIGDRDAITSYTAQDILGGPINLHLNASKAAIAAVLELLPTSELRTLVNPCDDRVAGAAVCAVDAVEA